MEILDSRVKEMSIELRDLRKDLYDMEKANKKMGSKLPAVSDGNSFLSSPM
jgi:hypothetical protein